MDNLGRKRRICLTIAAFIAYVLVVAIVTGGCEPLRKKFTRKKTKGTEETAEAPILEPMEYPKKVYHPEDLYKKYYSLWKVWHKELLENMSDNMSRKRQLYLLNQVVSNLLQMQELLLKQKQAEFKGVLDRLKKIQIDMETSLSPRSNASLKIELNRIEKTIRDDFSLDKVKDDIKE